MEATFHAPPPPPPAWIVALLLGLPDGWGTLARLDPTPATAAALVREMEAAAPAS